MSAVINRVRILLKKDYEDFRKIVLKGIQHQPVLELTKIYKNPITAPEKDFLKLYSSALRNYELEESLSEGEMKILSAGKEKVHCLLFHMYVDAIS